MGPFERRWRAASRRHWSILIACLAVVALGVRIAMGERPGPSVVVLPAPKPMTFETTAAEPEPAAGTEQAPPLDPGARGREKVEVCGLGWVDADAQGDVDPSVVGRMPALRATTERLLASLAASDDAFDRVVPVWLEALAPAGGDALERLAQAATTTADPRVYAIAFKACDKSPATPSCALLSARRWAQLDGENGEPWLFVFDDAMKRNDRVQADEALFRFGAAPRIESRAFAAAGAIAARAGGSDIALLAANMLSGTAVALGGADVGRLPLPAILGACRDAALADDSRRQRCDAAAAAMTERSDTLLYAGIGASIDRRLGWPAARVDALQALTTANLESWPNWEKLTSPWQQSCRHTSDILGRIVQLRDAGEPGAARRWIAASGMTFDRYVARSVERRRQEAEAFASAAKELRAGAEAASSSAR